MPREYYNMLLDRYESLFFNANFKEAASKAGWAAYRGELILKEGEIADAHGRRKPPTNVLKQAIALAAGDELKLISGSLDQLQEYPLFLEKFGADLRPDTLAVLFTVNISDPFVLSHNGATVVFIPLVQGMVWNELIDIAALEKGDFKGQGAADKVLTLYEALSGYRFKHPQATLDAALAKTNDARRETHGAV
jgi:hypothetical protein